MVNYFFLNSPDELSGVLSELFSRESENFFAVISGPFASHFFNIMPTGPEKITAFYYYKNKHYYCAFCEGDFLKEQLPNLSSSLIAEYVKQKQLPTLCLSKTILLSSIGIPKPWGQEIWYTGIEKRGVASVVCGNGEAIPLPWLLQFARPWLGVKDEDVFSPILLKILDPHPESVYGDLYFELHEEKQEVYVVTSIDKTAWPDGVGAIRLGFEPTKVAEHESPEAFKAVFLSAVQKYEAIRRKIDKHIDTLRLRDGVELQQPVDIEIQKKWDAEVPESWRVEEAQKRKAMNAFSALQPLKVGDVVKVPCYIPHALQHGVRVVEFQTPVYERCIVSFAQKVLTQEHWDTSYAVSRMDLSITEQEEFTHKKPLPGVLLETIVAFDDFTVERVTLDEGVCWDLPIMDTYQLVMAVGEGVICNGKPLHNEKSALLLAKKSADVANNASKKTTFLLARPINE